MKMDNPFSQGGRGLTNSAIRNFQKISEVSELGSVRRVPGCGQGLGDLVVFRGHRPLRRPPEGRRLGGHGGLLHRLQGEAVGSRSSQTAAQKNVNRGAEERPTKFRSPSLCIWERLLRGDNLPFYVP